MTEAAASMVDTPLDEVPFKSLEAADECVNILAPWWNESTLTVKHAEALTVRKGVLKCVLLVHVLQSHNVNSYNVGRSHPQKGEEVESHEVRSKTTTQRTPSKKDSKQGTPCDKVRVLTA